MAIQTYDDLTDRIDNDFSWRIVESIITIGELEKHDRTPIPLARAPQKIWRSHSVCALGRVLQERLVGVLRLSTGTTNTGSEASDGLAMLMLEKLSRSISDPEFSSGQRPPFAGPGDAEPQFRVSERTMS